jgi:PAS domain S-box-containing protein
MDSMSKLLEELAESRSQGVFESSPVATWIEDVSGITAALTQLRGQGVDDLATYLDLHPEFIEQALGQIKVLRVNRAALKMYEAESEEELLHGLDRLFTPQALTAFKEELLAVDQGLESFSAEVETCTLKGKPLDVLLAAAPIVAGDWRYVVVTVTDITERKRAEHQLGASREQYKDLVEKAGIAILIDREGGGFSYFNERFAEIFGFQPEDIPDLTHRDLVHADDYERVCKIHDDRLAGRPAPSRYEFRGIRNDGTQIWLEVDAVSVVEDGRIVGTRSYLWDISERKLLEDQLRASRASFAAIVDQNADGILVIANDQTVLFANPAAVELLGAPLDELVGSRLEVPPAAARGSGVEKVIRTPDGDQGVAEMRAVTTTWDGESAKLVMIRDATKRKQAELTLRKSEERYRHLFESNLAGVYRSTVDGRLLDCNSAFARIYGFASREEALSYPMSKLYADPALRTTFVSCLLKTGKLINYENEGRRCDGTPVAVLENSSLVVAEDHQVAVIEGTLIDITERKQLEQELLHAQKMEAVGRLAGGVAHEFNNLMQAMLSIAEAAKLAGPEAQETGVIAELESLILRGSSLTRQLLLFSRHEELQLEPLDLNQVIQENVRMLRRLVAENIHLELALTTEELPVRGDAVQLGQVLINLIVNATDALVEGGRLSISSGTQASERVWFEVADSGPGIPEHVRDKVFEPFFTTKTRGAGTGLGLTVVHGIVTKHDGTIEVDSQPEQGARVRVVLPREEVESTRDTWAAPLEGLIHGQGERVLLVEDEPATRDGLHEVLSMLGYQAVAVADAEEALELPLQPRFDLLITDLMLPGISGAGLAQQLLGRWSSLVVLLMSGYSEDIVAGQLPSLASYRLLNKPFSMAKLSQEIRNALDR